jgi:hypothetical protein
MFERRITEDDVRAVVKGGESIEDYPDDYPYPSRLVLGWRSLRSIHVVVAEHVKENELIVVTAYEPDPALWESGFKRIGS